MDGTGTTLWIPCGAAAAAVGLYLLMQAAMHRAVAARWIGRVLYALGGVAIAGVVLKPTGSFWSLLQPYPLPLALLVSSRAMT